MSIKRTALQAKILYHPSDHRLSRYTSVDITVSITVGNFTGVDRWFTVYLSYSNGVYAAVADLTKIANGASVQLDLIWTTPSRAGSYTGMIAYLFEMTSAGAFIRTIDTHTWDVTLRTPI